MGFDTFGGIFDDVCGLDKFNGSGVRNGDGAVASPRFGDTDGFGTSCETCDGRDGRDERVIDKFNGSGVLKGDGAVAVIWVGDFD